MTGWIEPSHYRLAAIVWHGLNPGRDSADCRGAFVVGRPVEMARLLRAGSWGNEKNLSICSTAALLVRDRTAASTVYRAADG